MKIFATNVIKELDAYTIENEPITSIDLMERAAKAIATAIAKRWNTDTRFFVFAGPGNNGGDALAVSRLLAEQGYQIKVFLFNPKIHLNPDCQTNLNRLKLQGLVDLQIVEKQFNPVDISNEDVIIDGLFGSGLSAPLSGGFAAVVRYLNATNAPIVSIDIPSGLMGENNTDNNPENIIHAKYTFSLQLPKLAFILPENEDIVGEWKLLDIGLNEEILEDKDTDYYLIEQEDLKGKVKPRSKFAHKGNFGRALLVAGSKGMAGASVLAAKGCLRSGVGYLQIHVPGSNNVIVQTAVPEATTNIDSNENVWTDMPQTKGFHAIGVGPGLGQNSKTESVLLKLIASAEVPMVLDADALNILGNHRDYLDKLPKGSILTPHPKELERLVGSCANSYERLEKARQLATQSQISIVLKGAYSCIITPEGKCLFNTTGNPGMATGGSGDVLMGVILGLLTEGYDATDAAVLGTYVHGLAGDLAARDLGQIALTSASILEYLPQVWKGFEDAAMQPRE